jgi:Bacteriodetes cell division protein (FtsL-like)
MQEQQNPKERNLPTGQAGQESNLAASGLKRWLNYQSVVKQVPFFLFLAMLAVVYIYNGHYADKTIRSINRTEKEVKELRYEYIAVKSEVMFLSKPSVLVESDAVVQLGLKELVQSPVILNDSTGKN